MLSELIKEFRKFAGYKISIRKTVAFIYSINEISEKDYSAMRRKEILSFLTTWMNLESIMLHKISETDTDKYYEITFMWNLKLSNS